MRDGNQVLKLGKATITIRVTTSMIRNGSVPAKISSKATVPSRADFMEKITMPNGGVIKPIQW